jgi:hypothetical protein
VLPASEWERLRGRTTGRAIARQRDLYRDCDVVLVTNR